MGVSDWQDGSVRSAEVGLDQRSSLVPLTCMHLLSHLNAVHIIVGQEKSRHGGTKASRALDVNAMLHPWFSQIARDTVAAWPVTACVAFISNTCVAKHAPLLPACNTMPLLP